MHQIPLGRDVLCSAERGASPQRYNRKYFAWCGNNQVFIPAAEVQQVFSRTGRHKNIKSWSGVEFQQSPWFRSTQPDPAAALPWDRLPERPHSVLHEGPPLHHTPSCQGGLRSQEDQLQSGYLLALLSHLCIVAGNWPSNPLSPQVGSAARPALTFGKQMHSVCCEGRFIPATTCTSQQRAPEISNGSSVFHTSSSIPHPC